MTTNPFGTDVEAITASDDEIRAHVAAAEVPPLLPALAYATGDLSLLRDDLRPDPLLVAMPQGGLTDAQLAEAHLEQTADIAATVAEAVDKAGPGARVCVLPEGPQTIPYVRD